MQPTLGDVSVTLSWTGARKTSAFEGLRRRPRPPRSLPAGDHRRLIL